MDTSTLIGTGFVVLGFVVWLFCAYLAYQQAPRFGRRNVTWGILGIIFGPFALFALYLLPKGHLEQPSGHRKADPRDDLYEVHRTKR
jgi:hypothetical protein